MSNSEPAMTDQPGLDESFGVVLTAKQIGALALAVVRYDGSAEAREVAWSALAPLAEAIGMDEADLLAPMLSIVQSDT